MRTLLIALICSFALAGCTTASDDDDSMGQIDELIIDASSYTLSATGVPATVAVGEAFTFTLDIAGPAGNSDHIGGHFWNATVADPDPNDAAIKSARGSCTHAPGGSDLPATLEITCAFDTEGTNTLFGHLAFTTEDATYNYWTAAFSVDVTPAGAMS